MDKAIRVIDKSTELADFPQTLSAGDILYWNGSNFSNLAKSQYGSVFIGGDSPSWSTKLSESSELFSIKSNLDVSGNTRIRGYISLDQITNPINNSLYTLSGKIWYKDNSGTETNIVDSINLKASISDPTLNGTVNITTPGTAALNIVRTGSLSNFTMPEGCSFSVSSTSNSAAGVSAAIVAGSASQSILYMGDTDSPTTGGIIYDNATDAIALRAGGSSRLSLSTSATISVNTLINGSLTIRGTNGVVMGDSAAADTAKSARIMMHSYGSVSNSFCMLLGSAQQQYNVIVFGGGTAAGYAATHVRFVAAANNTTTTGTTISDWTIDKAKYNIPVQLPTYTVATIPSASTAGIGAIVYCIDGDAGQPCLAVSNNANWKRISLGTNISTT